MTDDPQWANTIKAIEEVDEAIVSMNERVKRERAARIARAKTEGEYERPAFPELDVGLRTQPKEKP